MLTQEFLAALAKTAADPRNVTGRSRTVRPGPAARAALADGPPKASVRPPHRYGVPVRRPPAEE